MLATCCTQLLHASAGKEGSRPPTCAPCKQPESCWPPGHPCMMPEPSRKGSSTVSRFRKSYVIFRKSLCTRHPRRMGDGLWDNFHVSNGCRKGSCLRHTIIASSKHSKQVSSTLAVSTVLVGYHVIAIWLRKKHGSITKHRVVA